VAQVVEHLSSRHKALSSNPSATKQKQAKKKKTKITRAKWTGGVAQAIECLLCKYKALNSNPSPTKKKKKKSVNSIPPIIREKKMGRIMWNKL
jgi:hypothetical protein